MRLIIIGLNVISGKLKTHIYKNIYIVPFIIFRYKSIVEIKKIRLGRIAENDGIYSSNLLVKLGVELFVNLIFIPPNLSGMYNITGSIFVRYNLEKLFNSTVIPIYNVNNTDITLDDYSFDYKSNNLVNSYTYPKEVLVNLNYDASNLISMLMLLRCYHFIRLVYSFSDWSTTKADKVCKLMNTQASVGFSLKAYLKVSPFSLLGIGTFVIIIIFGLGIRLAEYYNDYMIQLLDSDAPKFTYDRSP